MASRRVWREQNVKSVKKIFKKVVKVVKKIAVPVLAAAAIFFTAGAALGFAPMLGGFGAAVSTATASLGTGVVGGVVTGAITSAGYGAAIGGITSAATGGSFSKGAQTGAAVGAVTGGISGGFNAARAAAVPTGPGAPPPGTTPPITPPITPAPGRDAVANMFGNVPEKVSTGGLFQKGGWLERNQDLMGPVIGGIGQGLIAGAESDAYRGALRDRFRLTAANYAGTDPGTNFRDVAPGTSSQSPRDRYDPRTYGSFEYQYDPTQGRIIKVPVGG